MKFITHKQTVRPLRDQPGFGVITILCLIFLFLPIVILVVFAFNKTQSVTTWGGFSLEWFATALSSKEARAAAFVSIKLALSATVIATFCATLAALATTRTKPFRGEGLVFAALNQPLMVPEIVTAVALLSFFAIVKKATGIEGGLYLILGHSLFCIPFAYMPIRARLQGMDKRMEEAGADLYAPPLRIFKTITLPLLAPGILSGAILSFIVSLDDVLISLLVAGPGELTLPLYIWGKIKRGLTPEINAISTILLVLTVCVLLFLSWLGKRDNNRGTT